MLTFVCYTVRMRTKRLQPPPMPDDLQPWERFEYFAKALLSVPKKELDAVTADYEKKKKQRAKKRKAVHPVGKKVSL